MEPVSQFINQQLYTEYSDVKYGHKSSKNSILIQRECSKLIVLLAYADASEGNMFVPQLHQKLNDILLLCKDDIEYKRVNKFLLDLSKKGGYAVTFYNEVKHLFDDYLTEKSK